jgi:Pyruvate/2-oxoacid:ferredoxin oxidoreductase delta subunit
VKKTAFVAIDRCKGCEICVGICDTLAKHHAIKMVAADQVKYPFEMAKGALPR